MRNIYLPVILIFIITLGSCTLPENNNDTNETEKNKSYKNIRNISLSEISIDRLKELEQISVDTNYHVERKIEIADLKYIDMQFEDMLHLIFQDKNNNHYDFNSNRTNIKLYIETKDLNNTLSVYEPNNKYIDKTFKVIWRKLKLNHKPQNEMEMYYEEYNEIIYLQEINN